MKIKSKNLGIRISVAVFIIVSLALFYEQFYLQFNCYLKGAAHTITQAWHITFLNIFLFLLLLLPLSFKRKARWGDYGIVTAFFVSLFVEMYGFPLTLYFASRYFTEPVLCASGVFSFNFWGVNFVMETAMVYTSFLILIGTILIIVGWITLYKNSKTGNFVTTGIYKYSRHPQYLGFILVIIGWLLDWPTLITLIFVPILIYKYIKACTIEEREVTLKYPEYQEYKNKTPFLI